MDKEMEQDLKDLKKRLTNLEFIVGRIEDQLLNIEVVLEAKEIISFASQSQKKKE